MIRRARYSDIPGLTALMIEAFNRSKWRGIGNVDVRETKASFVRWIQRDGLKREGGTIVQVAEKDGIMTGFLVGALHRLYEIGDRLEAQQVYLYQGIGADPVDTIRLAVAFDHWAESVTGCINAQQSITDIIVSEFPEAARIFTGLGYKQTGAIYERRVLQ